MRISTTIAAAVALIGIRPLVSVGQAAPDPAADVGIEPARTSDQPWLYDDNDYVAIETPRPAPAEMRRSGGGRLATLRSEREWILGRYDHGAIPHAVYSVVRDLEIEISELQIKASR